MKLFLASNQVILFKLFDHFTQVNKVQDNVIG